jgi:hypothetical protein
LSILSLLVVEGVAVLAVVLEVLERELDFL